MKKKDVVFETVKESFHYDEFISALQKNKVTGLEAQEVSERLAWCAAMPVLC